METVSIEIPIIALYAIVVLVTGALLWCFIFENMENIIEGHAKIPYYTVLLAGVTILFMVYQVIIYNR